MAPGAEASASSRAPSTILEPGGERYDSDEADPTTLRRLSASLAGLQSAVESADAAPTPDAVTGFAERRKLVATGLARWQEVLATELPKANRSFESAGLPPIEYD
jgi:hypothetical protein